MKYWGRVLESVSLRPQFLKWFTNQYRGYEEIMKFETTNILSHSELFDQASNKGQEKGFKKGKQYNNYY